VITTNEASIAISPANPERFIDRYSTQKEMGPSEEMEPVSIQPAINDRGLLTDRWVLILLSIGFVFNLGLYFLVSAFHDQLPHTLPYHFVDSGLPDLVGSPARLFTLAALGTLAWIIDGILGIVIYFRQKERSAAYLLWGAAAGLQLLFCVAIGGLIKG